MKMLWAVIKPHYHRGKIRVHRHRYPQKMSQVEADIEGFSVKFPIFIHQHNSIYTNGIYNHDFICMIIFTAKMVFICLMEGIALQTILAFF